MLGMIDLHKRVAPSTTELECDSFTPKNQEYLRHRDKEGPQGAYESYGEYVLTVNLFNACYAKDFDREKVANLMHVLGLHSRSLIAIKFSGLPINPYAGDEHETLDCKGYTPLIEIIRGYYKNEKAQDLIATYKSPLPDKADLMRVLSWAAKAGNFVVTKQMQIAINELDYRESVRHRTQYSAKAC